MATNCDVKNGCFCGLLKLSCDCMVIIRIKNRIVVSYLSSPKILAVVTYPVNIMVAEYLKPNINFSTFVGHQLLLQEDMSDAHQLQVYEKKLVLPLWLIHKQMNYNFTR